MMGVKGNEASGKDSGLVAGILSGVKGGDVAEAGVLFELMVDKELDPIADNLVVAA